MSRVVDIAQIVDRKHTLHLSDLRDWHELEIVCGFWHYVGRLKPKALIALLSRRRRVNAARTPRLAAEGRGG